MSDTAGGATPGERGTLTVRARNAQALGGAMVAVGVLGLVVVLTEGIDSVLQYAAPLALFGLLGWAAFWQPLVEVSDGGVKVVNTWRTRDVPWPAIESLDGRFGLTLHTAYGRITAWGASAPTGRNRARQPLGEAAEAVTSRLEELRRAGFLDDRRLERPAPVARWHTRTLAAAGVLLVLSVALPFLR
jgi:hypothetical protein